MIYLFPSGNRRFSDAYRYAGDAAMGRDVPEDKIEVTAYSGYKADERPVSFALRGERREVKEISDRWYGTEDDYFKVLADDGKTYLLRRHRCLDIWFLVKMTP